MFKKIMNSMMAITLTSVAMLSWDLVGSGNSLFLFGEPDFPSELEKRD